VKGELAAARKQTDEAIRKAYDILNALAVLAPTDDLSALVNVLFGIEERAKLYYISGASASGVKPAAGDGSSSDGGLTTGNDNQNDNENGGGSSSESGSGSSSGGTGSITPGGGSSDNGGGSGSGSGSNDGGYNFG